MVNKKVFFVKLAAILVIATSGPVSAQDLALEEIVVTAQRREQSLQEVPISIEVISGVQLDMQGWQNVQDIAKFSASVNVLDSITGGVTTTIRGLGTVGTSMTMEAAAPLFLDGIHFGTLAMARNAFMDVERVEVLKGPQPLHFGMNATSGAFNIQTKRPTPEWEGDYAVEVGSWDSKEITGAFGGPLTETLAFRTSLRSASTDGPVKSYFDGHRFPALKNLGGRISLLWTPSDKLNVFSKFDIFSQRNKDGDLVMGCLTEGRAAGYPTRTPIDGNVNETADRGNFSSILVPPPSGITGGWTDVFLNPEGVLPRGHDGTGAGCFSGNYAFSDGGAPVAPPANADGGIARFIGQGAFDGRALVTDFTTQQIHDGSGLNGIDVGGILDRVIDDGWNAVIEVNYQLDNDINIQSQTGAVKYGHHDSRTSDISNIFGNMVWRGQDMYQYSQQLRVTSPDDGYDLNLDIPGGVNLEFMGGGFWQHSEKDMYSYAILTNFERGHRFNTIWEDATWWAGFWSLDLNFMDEQLSLSVGGRYTDVTKDGLLLGWGASWIFDEVPCDSEGTDANPATCQIDPHFKRVHPNLTTETYLDPVTGRGALGSPSITRPANLVRVDSPRFLQPGANLNNLWTGIGYLTLPHSTKGVPLNWRSPDGPQAVGMTAPVYANQQGPYGTCDSCKGSLLQKANDYSPQIVISFTPNALDGNHTFYGKWVQAFKGPATDTGISTIPAEISGVLYNPEYSEAWEVGARGQLLENRIHYDVSAFTNEFTDLQMQGAAPFFNPQFVNSTALNAGSQKVDGLEFSLQAAATPNLLLNFGGAFLDGKFGNFDGNGCSKDAFIAASIDALTPTANGGSMENRSAAERTFANTILNNLGPVRRANLPAREDLPDDYFMNGGCRLEDTAEFAAGVSSVGARQTMDLTGMTPPLTPDWKFLMGATYTRPVMDSYEAFLDVVGYIEAGKTLAIESWEMVYRDGHGDMNLSLGFGPQTGTWQVVGFVRNILQDRPAFRAEYDLEQTGLYSSNGTNSGAPDGAFSSAQFRSYGVRFVQRF